jgi:hypothetical protein
MGIQPRWATGISVVNVLIEMLRLSQYHVNPSEGHMKQLLHIIGFLKKDTKLTLYVLTELPKMDYCEFCTQKSFPDKQSCQGENNATSITIAAR